MAYTKTTWAADTDITPALLDHAEGQYDEAVNYIDANLRLDTSLELRSEVAAAAPAHAAGRLYYDSVAGEYYVSDGSTWLPVTGVQ